MVSPARQLGLPDKQTCELELAGLLPDTRKIGDIFIIPELSDLTDP